MQASYNQDIARQYRKNDKRDIQTAASKQVISNLSDICQSYTKKTYVGDIGCGSGRFFHALSNVNKLIGLDISSDMLAVALHPVNEFQMDIEQVKLIQGDCFSIRLPTARFDIIYSIGVFGSPVPLNLGIINKLYSLLAPGGTLFFTIADMSDPNYQGQFQKSHIRKCLEFCYPILPTMMKNRLRARWQHYFLKPSELNEFMVESEFDDFSTWKMVNRFYACKAVKGG
jgi:ubiquinone/menaquinone biosynthesis C-methylase UbiE